ncbi:MAG: hypothetical protein EBW14_10300, partial [Oxalobacteraceae bacterium]|nr:hypothetical protein [Oxalobacteraceae bacterium]
MPSPICGLFLGYRQVATDRLLGGSRPIDMTIKNYSRPAAKMWRDRNGFPQVIKGLRSTVDSKGYGNQD